MSRQARIAAQSPFGEAKLSRKQLEHFCQIEEWSADTETGQIRLGPISSKLHGVDMMNCGLSNVIACYEKKDQASILQIFETVTSESTPFTYSTVLECELGIQQPVFCIGESDLDEDSGGTIGGIFIFPYVPLDKVNNFIQ
ncbi:MAG: hypothetical protein ABJO86_07920 [Lentilitoribacter sp.]